MQTAGRTTSFTPRVPMTSRMREVISELPRIRNELAAITRKAKQELLAGSSPAEETGAWKPRTGRAACYFFQFLAQLGSSTADEGVWTGLASWRERGAVAEMSGLHGAGLGHLEGCRKRAAGLDCGLGEQPGLPVGWHQLTICWRAHRC